MPDSVRRQCFATVTVEVGDLLADHGDLAASISPDRQACWTAGRSAAWQPVPYRAVGGLLRATEDARSMDQRRTDALGDLLLGRTEPASVDIGVIVPADTLTGRGSEPGGCPASDPSPLARLVSSSGAALAVRSTLGTQLGYRPSVALDRAVRARDVTCRFPGCRRTADSAGTDLDHTVPYPAGPTAAANLAVLCRRHHRLKHTAGWTVHLHPTGVMTWTTPTGRTYQAEPWKYLNPEHERDPDPPPRE